MIINKKSVLPIYEENLSKVSIVLRDFRLHQKTEQIKSDAISMKIDIFCEGDELSFIHLVYVGSSDNKTLMNVDLEKLKILTEDLFQYINAEEVLKRIAREILRYCYIMYSLRERYMDMEIFGLM